MDRVTSAEIVDFVQHWKGKKMGRGEGSKGPNAVTKDVVITRARQIVHEHGDTLRGLGAGERLRGLLAAEFGGSSGLRAVSTRTLAQLVAQYIPDGPAPAPVRVDVLPRAKLRRNDKPDPAWKAADDPAERGQYGHGSPEEIRCAIDKALWLQERGYISGRLMAQVMNEIMAARTLPQLAAPAEASEHEEDA